MKPSLHAIDELLEEDTRFKRSAYNFISDSLQYAHEHMNLPDVAHASENAEATSRPSPKHVTGQQLCQACRLYALEQYGFMAKTVLATWGIHSTSDFGELVYNLIRIEHMRKSDTDRREDFDDVYSFDDAFEPEFEFVPRDDD